MTPDPEEVEKAAKEPEVKPRPEPSEAEYKEASNILWVIEQGGGDMALFLGSILAEKRTAFQARLAEKEAEVERLKVAHMDAMATLGPWRPRAEAADRQVAALSKKLALARAEAFEEAAKIECRYCRMETPSLYFTDSLGGQQYCHDLYGGKSICVSSRIWARAAAERAKAEGER